MRTSGVLNHISSLPNEYGIGKFGREARDFVDFLVKAGQSIWQILPLSQTSFGDSPYQSFSIYAGNPYFIDFEQLEDEGILLKEEYAFVNWGSDKNFIDYDLLYKNIYKVLRTAFTRFDTKSEDFKKFKEENSSWIYDYGLFMALKNSHDGSSWSEWETSLKFREPQVIEWSMIEHFNEIEFQCFLQYKFNEQWFKLKEYANNAGVIIIGDIPIYAAFDSVDVWCNPSLFQLDNNLLPTDVAGFPPDAFSVDGQLWGNPLYDWDKMKEDGYSWWVGRIKAAKKLYDLVRIDHFIGFDRYYAIKFGSVNARNGEWRDGPKYSLFEKLVEETGEGSIIAEDLGIITPSVRKLLTQCGYPGMKVLQFGLYPSADSDYLPHNFKNTNCLVYTGTHDNETIMGWAKDTDEENLEFALKYLNVKNADNLSWNVMRLGWLSVAQTAMTTTQDLLGLDNVARTNIPSTVGTNWRWRYKKGDLTDEIAEKLKDLSKLSSRNVEMIKRYEKERTKLMEKKNLMEAFLKNLSEKYGKKPTQAKPYELHDALSKAIMDGIMPNWDSSKIAHQKTRKASYLSMEFLVGRAVYNNLLCTGEFEDCKEIFQECGISLADMEEIRDSALGNGGLGRLAACFLDSATTLSLPLDGYGIRYKYGLFKQDFKNGFQSESADDWTEFGDPWSIRRDSETVQVKFSDMTVNAVPYDYPIIGYGTKNVGTLRLWQAESVNQFDFDKFNTGDFDGSMTDRAKAESISCVLYPNDDNESGRLLRLRQEYFFSSASVTDLVKKHVETFGTIDNFADYNAIQLNDTHPVIALPELILQLTRDFDKTFDEAFKIAQKTFSYTNHTIMAEALEKWNGEIIEKYLPEIYNVIIELNERFVADMYTKGISRKKIDTMKLIQKGTVHMASIAIYASSYTNGVAQIHTDILKNQALKDWYKVYPERFQNKTNGITQRRWLALCNPELSKMITNLLGTDEWVTKLDMLKNLEKFAEDEDVLYKFLDIKNTKKQQLAYFIKKNEHIEVDSNSIFDVQIKRLHEYKRQLMNAFSILYIYFGIKDGSITNFNKTTFIFGAKSAPGYKRAKGIIKFINEIASLCENDLATRDLIKVVFVSDYRVSYAEKLVAGADFSEQISTAGTEASGTGNMKFMLNGTCTLGTYDGANVEIVAEAGEENNYIFGARVEDLEEIMKDYDPRKLMATNPKIKKVVDTLIDGTLSDDDTGIFRELYFSLLDGASWHRADNYYVLGDLESYVQAKLLANSEYSNKLKFAKKCWLNMCNAGKFSSDRTISDYAQNIWKISKVSVD